MTTPASLTRSVDAYLRDSGFRIEARPPAGPVLWREGLCVYTQREALNIARRREAREAAEEKRRKDLIARELQRVNA